LAISFVPYIIWFCALMLIVEIYLIIHESKRRTKNKTFKIFITILITILTIWIGTLYSSEFFWFYNQNDESIRITNAEKWIKIFYANIYYKNTDYKSLQEKIEQENPDIVILVEFSDEHEREMKDFFRKNYPYINRNSWSTMLAWDAVFSKIPLENITETHLVEAWSRNYGYMKILCDECDEWIDLYVIHTSAPVSNMNFEMRNVQIWKLLSDYLQHHTNWTPTVIIWDFNLSPWSYYYKQFTKHLKLLNALSYQSPSYTRSLLQQWIFRSHIDQLFISPEIKVSPVKIENLSGSDHRSFSFSVGL
jgi:endonuclease/exonuclease/phosphatase (EEP) superfamily protein YafD